MTLAENFFALFSGHPDAYGRYSIAKTATANARGKLTGSAGTVKKPVTVQLWEDHLAGTMGLGIVPVHPDLTCRFAAIDIDIYPTDPIEIEAKITQLKLPLLATRSKSGGVHAYLFLSEPVEAKLVVDKLRTWAHALGCKPEVEIFPKQTMEVDTGNWINMPYFEGDYSLRYGIRKGVALSPEDYIEYAKELSIDKATLITTYPAIAGGSTKVETLEDIFFGAPHCLGILIKEGFPAGSRNAALFDIAVFLRKSNQLDKLQLVNEMVMVPPKSHAEVDATRRQVAKKSYSYKCNEMPIVAHCNKELCHNCIFGVKQRGAEAADIEIGKLVQLRTEPPTWEIEVEGKPITMTTQELLDQTKFAARVVEELQIWPDILRAPIWKKTIREKLKEAEVKAVPLDATRRGQILTHLHLYCTGRAVAKTLDEILLNKPFTEDGRTYFLPLGFTEHLAQRRAAASERDLYNWLLYIGLQSHEKRIKRKLVRYWSVPAFTEQEEEFETPRAPGEEEM